MMTVVRPTSEAQVNRLTMVLILALIVLWVLAAVAIAMVVTGSDLAGHLPLTGHAYDDTGIA